VDAVQEVSFDVHAGEMIALLGPNGAGAHLDAVALWSATLRCGGRLIWKRCDRCVSSVRTCALRPRKNWPTAPTSGLACYIRRRGSGAGAVAGRFLAFQTRPAPLR
jgi:hypothetical protein